ncbi:MAG TPA: VWA domain-containing protein [Pyrinomonadaceae bacterium]|nr:VWA domain-containing protein [Pyrinomonadaceae bacterium]
MLKDLSNTSHTVRRALMLMPRVLLMPALLILGSVPRGVQAQQQSSPERQQQQRPRRVGGQAPAAADRPAPSSTPSVGEEVDEDDVVRVDTQLVSVPAIVTDSAGRILTGLRADNFSVFEDGSAQRIANFATTEAPFEVALLLDTSGSTRADVGLIRRAANAFIESLRPGDRVAVIAFSSVPDGASKLATIEIKTKLTDNRAALREAVESIGSSNGTPFYDGLERVARDVFRESPRDEARGRQALVALTDGVDSTSETEFADARDQLRRAGLVCYFIQVNTEEFVENRLLQDCADNGTLTLSRQQLQRYRRIFASSADAADYSSFCRLGQFERMDISRALYKLARQEMDTLARDSGGRTYTVAELREARAAFARIAAEIGTQYSLGYYPTNKARDGRFRTIRVEVRGVKNAQVRAREGYQAPRS